MSTHSQQTSRSKQLFKVSNGLQALKGGLGKFLALLLIIWVALPLVPKETGLRFGLAYQTFFTAMLLLGALFFWFLGKERIPLPRGSGGILASLAVVYLLTVGILVTAGVIYPQFQRPQPPGASAQKPEERGKALFWSENVGCFRCHSISGTGGTRGPDQTHAASRADQRVEGLSATEYLREKIKAGMTFRYLVPDYTPMMPAFGQILTEEQIKDLVAYLLTLK